MVYLPAIAQMGLQANIQLKKWGWYPKGGGEVISEIQPSELRGISLSERGVQRDVRVVSATSNLPVSIARRQLDSALRMMKASKGEVSSEMVDAPARDKGTLAFIAAEFERGRAGFTSLGEKGKRAETVGEEAGRQYMDFLKTGAAIDEHLADQLVLLMALARGSSSFSTSRITSHLLTNIWVAEQFLPIEFRVTGDEGEPGEVSVCGVGFGQSDEE
jgi:RNA 3'-terminal phosphate cyclase (ATP)